MSAAARTPTGETYQAPAVGPVRTLAVGPTWIDLLDGVPETDRLSYDLAAIRVPPGSKRVLLRQDAAIDGTPADASQEPTSWVLDPGVHPLSINRGAADGRFFLAVDPTDSGAGTSPVVVKVMRAG